MSILSRAARRITSVVVALGALSMFAVQAASRGGPHADPCAAVFAQVEKLRERGVKEGWSVVQSLCTVVVDDGALPQEALTAALAGEEIALPTGKAGKQLREAVTCVLTQSADTASPDALGRLFVLAAALDARFDPSPAAVESFFGLFKNESSIDPEAYAGAVALLRTGLDGGRDLRWAIRIVLDAGRFLEKPGREVRRQVETALDAAASGRRIPREVVTALEATFFTAPALHTETRPGDCSASAREALAREVEELSDYKFYAQLLPSSDPGKRAFQEAQKRTSAAYVDVLTRCPAVAARER
jgi:hypothetical protein